MMTVPNPYFKDVPGLGDLKMEQIIVDYVYPLLSVLQDDSEKRYLCMCFDTRGAQQWLVTPISNSVLVSLLRNEVTLSSPFEDSDTKKFKVTMDYHTRKETFELLDASQIPKEDLPEEGEYLDVEQDEWIEYIRTLRPVRTKGMITSGILFYHGVANGMSSVRWRHGHQQSRKVGRYVSCMAR